MKLHQVPWGSMQLDRLTVASSPLITRMQLAGLTKVQERETPFHWREWTRKEFEETTIENKRKNFLLFK